MEQTAYLGTPEEFPRRIRETDPRYKNANQRYQDTLHVPKQVKEEIKDMKDGALAKVMLQIEKLQGWQAISEYANAYFFVLRQLEEARIKSLEDTLETWVVLAFPMTKDMMKNHDDKWCRILPWREAEKVKVQSDSFIEFGRFQGGKRLEVES